MIDVSKTIEPKSDQMNADDLIVGSRTIKITGVKIGSYIFSTVKNPDAFIFYMIKCIAGIKQDIRFIADDDIVFSGKDPVKIIVSWIKYIPKIYKFNFDIFHIWLPGK